MEDKKYYCIEIGGESSGYCYRKLSDAEYELVKGILDETQSEYVGGSIIEIVPKYVVCVFYEVNEKHIKQNNTIFYYGYNFVAVEPDIKHFGPHEYSDYVHRKYFYFDTEVEANEFIEKTQASMSDCKFYNTTHNEVKEFFKNKK